MINIRQARQDDTSRLAEIEIFNYRLILTIAFSLTVIKFINPQDFYFLRVCFCISSSHNKCFGHV